MSKRTLFIEEKQGYFITTLEQCYKVLETLANQKFEGLYTTSLDCNSKYTLDVILTATDNSSYISYDLGLTLYKKENGVAQHSLRLALDYPKGTLGNSVEPIYTGYSTPCFRGKPKTEQATSFKRTWLSPKGIYYLVVDGIPKEELLSAYFEGTNALTDFMTKVVTKAQYPHLKVEGLEDD